MQVEGISSGSMGVQIKAPQGNDSVTKSIQNQIQNKEQQLQKLSENEDLSPEEKMKKRQEIQKEIQELQKQLRQHQNEMRRKQSQGREDSMDKMLGGNRNSGSSDNGSLSQGSMKAMISADSTMKQVRAQESTATKLEGDARNLRAQIRTDAQRGDSVEAEEEALADLEERVSNIRATQVGMLSDTVSDMKAAKEEENAGAQKEDSEEAEKEKKTAKEGTVAASGDEKAGKDNNVSQSGALAASSGNAVNIPGGSSSGEHTAAADTSAAPKADVPVNYTPVDILL